MLSIDDTTSFKDNFNIYVVNELVDGCPSMFIFFTFWWIFSRSSTHCKMRNSSAYQSKLRKKSSVYFNHFCNTHQSSPPLIISAQICRVSTMLDCFSTSYVTSILMYFFIISLVALVELKWKVQIAFKGKWETVLSQLFTQKTSHQFCTTAQESWVCSYKIVWKPAQCFSETLLSYCTVLRFCYEHNSCGLISI